jgi:hypothetical protein
LNGEDPRWGITENDLYYEYCFAKLREMDGEMMMEKEEIRKEMITELSKIRISFLSYFGAGRLKDLSEFMEGMRPEQKAKFIEKKMRELGLFPHK